MAKFQNQNAGNVARLAKNIDPQKDTKRYGLKKVAEPVSGSEQKEPAQVPDLQRLNAAIAHMGYCSRRAADTLIFDGKVRVNGHIETNPGRRITSDDVIEIDNAIVKNKSAELVYILLHKPIHVVCTVRDPQGRKTVIDLLPDKYKKIRLYPVGRLDYFSEGLLLLTNDGDLAHRLMHPSFHQPKVYEVIVRGNVPESALEKIHSGMIIEDSIQLLPAKVKAVVLKNGNTLLTLELRQGINRQIRKMCEELGLTILKLKRVSVGSLTLGNLQPGACRELDKNAVERLKIDAGLN